MRNTITLNGVESSTIPGLLIQELPAISKPLMRTEVETIDGRDGDITTDLGFSAYDKQISIGLFADYDIDQIIAYFNSKGTVIFSNEPDKFYNYEIVDQIDFERLVRYRTATVTMHCQPFKYSTTEGADILSTNSNFATLDQSINSDSSNFSYSSNVQADVTATRTTTTGGGKFFATFTMNVAQGVTYYFSGNAANNCTMYGYKDRIWGTSAGFSGRKLPQFPSYTATYTGTLIIGFYSVTTEPVFIRNFKVSNQSTSTVTGEGTNIVLENSAEAPFSRFDLKGNTEQDTYSGKNLFDYTEYSASAGGLTTTLNDDGSLTISGVPTSSYVDIVPRKDIIDLLEDGATYTLSQSYSDTPKALFIEITASKTGGGTDYYDSTFTVDKTTHTNYRIHVCSNTRAVWGDESRTITSNFQLEKGSTATEFERYVGGIASPNPDYPQDVKVVTGENTVRICGKNLYDYVTHIRSSGSGLTNTLNQDGSITTTGVPTEDWVQIVSSYNIKDLLEDGATYTFSQSYDPTNYYALVFVEIAAPKIGGGTDYYRPQTNGGKMVVDKATHASFNIRVCAQVMSRWGDQPRTITSNFQLEKGSAPTEFEPYQEQSYPISLGSLELCKIGNYQDYFYKSGDKWYKHKVVGKYKFTSSETGSYQSSFPRFSINFSHGQDSTAAVASQALCTHLKVGQTANTNNTFGIGANVIYIRNESCTSLTELNQWFANNDVTVYYALATPIDEEITNETLKAQLEATSQANAYRGRTHIDASAASGNVPHIIAAEVTTDPSGTITNSGNIYSKPKLTIFGSGNVGVYLNGVQMFQIALGTDDHITIDTAIMEAYQDNLQTLKNRSVTGDYNNFKLPVGESEISFSGNVTMCVVENYSRWL